MEQWPRKSSLLVSWDFFFFLVYEFISIKYPDFFFSLRTFYKLKSNSQQRERKRRDTETSKVAASEGIRYFPLREWEDQVSRCTLQSTQWNSGLFFGDVKSLSFEVTGFRWLDAKFRFGKLLDLSIGWPHDFARLLLWKDAVIWRSPRTRTIRTHKSLLSAVSPMHVPLPEEEADTYPVSACCSAGN